MQTSFYLTILRQYYDDITLTLWSRCDYYIKVIITNPV